MSAPNTLYYNCEFHRQWQVLSQLQINFLIVVSSEVEMRKRFPFYKNKRAKFSFFNFSRKQRFGVETLCIYFCKGVNDKWLNIFFFLIGMLLDGILT
jgi:hypothetical protein